MKSDDRIREAEARLFARSGLQHEESFFDLKSVRARRGSSASEPGRRW